MTPYRQTLYVLEDKAPGIEFLNQTYELQNKPVPGILKRSMPNQGKALTWRPAEYTIHNTAPYPCRIADISPGESNYRPRDDRGIWKIELMNGTVDRIDFDRCRDVEAGLLKPEAQATGAGE